MSNNPADRLAAWIVEKALEEAPGKRAQILRDAADTLAGGKAAGMLRELANDVERQESLHQQLILEFRRDFPEEKGTAPPSEDMS